MDPGLALERLKVKTLRYLRLAPPIEEEIIESVRALRPLKRITRERPEAALSLFL